MAKKADNDADAWRGEEDHRVLSRSAEIRGDATRMAGVKKHHLKQKRVLGTVGKMLGGKR
jgi:hypothetical protein